MAFIIHVHYLFGKRHNVSVSEVYSPCNLCVPELASLPAIQSFFFFLLSVYSIWGLSTLVFLITLQHLCVVHIPSLYDTSLFHHASYQLYLVLSLVSERCLFLVNCIGAVLVKPGFLIITHCILHQILEVLWRIKLSSLALQVRLPFAKTGMLLDVTKFYRIQAISIPYAKNGGTCCVSCFLMMVSNSGQLL